MLREIRMCSQLVQHRARTLKSWLDLTRLQEHYNHKHKFAIFGHWVNSNGEATPKKSYSVDRTRQLPQ